MYDNDKWLRYDQNQGWGGCYCTFYDDVREEDEINAGKDKRGDNREARRKTIQEGRASGLLAYAGGRVVGWCNVAEKSRYANPRHILKVSEPGEKVGAITCFLVLAEFRGQGLAKRMLASACNLVKSWELPVAEAYPRNPELPFDPKEIPGANVNFRGSLRMFTDAGFEVHRKLERFSLVRKNLPRK